MAAMSQWARLCEAIFFIAGKRYDNCARNTSKFTLDMPGTLYKCPVYERPIAIAIPLINNDISAARWPREKCKILFEMDHISVQLNNLIQQS